MFAKGEWVQFYYPMKCCPIKYALWRKPSRQFWRKNLHKKLTPHSTLDVYDKIPIFIPVDIMEDAVKSVAPKIFWEFGPRWYGLRRSKEVYFKIWGGQP